MSERGNYCEELVSVLQLSAKEEVVFRAKMSISDCKQCLEGLRSMFLEDRIASLVRRSAPVFDGQCAVDWLLDGRWEEVIGKYDDLLRYQG